MVASSRYVALVGVVFGLLAALTAFCWGAVKTVLVALKLLHGQLDGMAVALVQVMDGFLIAAGLLIFSLGLYELFIAKIHLPAWLAVSDVDALEAKLAGVIVMVMAVTFLERLESTQEARGLLETGLSVAAVSAVLVWLTRKKSD